MLNQFDFYSIQVSSPRKGDLKRAGIDPKKINSERNGYKTYGRGMYAKQYPQWLYVASVGFCEANGNPDKIAEEWRGKGLTVAVKYYARD